MKLGALVVAVGLFFAGSAFCGEPNEDAAKIIAQIQARQAAKAEAAAAQQKQSLDREKGERRAWTGQAGGANPGAAINSR